MTEGMTVSMTERKTYIETYIDRVDVIKSMTDMESACLTYVCLTEHDYKYHCTLCGYHSAILVMDVLGDFHLNVSS